MANKLRGVVELPDDKAYDTLKKTGTYTDADGVTITYDPNWLYVTPNTVASNVAQQKLQIEDIYSKLTNTVTVDGVQTITGPKTFQESIYLANTDGTTDRIAHINNNFIIYSGANNGVALLNIDEGLGTISAFNKQLAFKDDITGGGGGGTGNTTVYVADTAVEEVRFDSDPQTQISAKASQSDFDKLVNNETIIQSNSKNSLFLGATSTTTGNSIIIGKDASAKSGGHRAIVIGNGATSAGGGVAIGLNTNVSDSFGIAIGSGGSVGAKVTGNDSIQLGEGTNSTSNSFQLHNDNIYNWGTHTLTVQNIELNGENITTAFDAKYLPIAGGTLTGGLSINGDLTIIGNITQQGGSYITHAEQVYSTKDYIYLREGNTGALADGAYTGFEFIKYDGTNNGRLVVDNKGIARVGDVGEEQPLATREETPIDGGFAKWDAATNKFVTTASVGDYLPLSGGTMSGAINYKNSGGINFSQGDDLQYQIGYSNGILSIAPAREFLGNSILRSDGSSVLLGSYLGPLSFAGTTERPTYTGSGFTPDRGLAFEDELTSFAKVEVFDSESEALAASQADPNKICLY